MRSIINAAIKFSLSLFAVMLFTANYSQAQCVIRAYAQPKTICAGDQVFFSANGKCNYLMNNTFDSLTLGAGWSSTAANPVFSNPCGPGPSGAHAWVGTTASSTRTLETVNYDVSIGNCAVEFDMRYGRVQGSGNCEDPDAANEGVHLQYSTNNGTTWTDFPAPNIVPVGPNTTAPPFTTTTPGTGGYWQPENNEPAQLASGLYFWHRYSCPVPSIAATTNTKFRWAQLATSSTGYDAWGIDEVEISCPDTNAIVEWTDPTGAVMGNVLNLGYYTPTMSGWYYCTITDTFSGSWATDSVYITINPNPTSDFAISDTSICQNENISYTFTGSADTAATYTWTFDGTNVSGQGPHTFNYPDDGVYTISLQINDKGCVSPKTTKTVTVNKLPMVSFLLDRYNGCQPLTVNFTNATSPTTSTYVWNFGDGGTSMDVNPTYTYNNPGNFSVSLEATTDKGCVDSVTIPNIITVYSSPVASFMANPNPTTLKQSTVQFNDVSGNAFSWFWDFDDPGSGNTTSTQQNPSHTFSTDGEFDVWLYVTSMDGCEDSVNLEVIVFVDEITVPNVMTPNGDGYNDVFEITNIDRMMSSHLKIYNRWGKKVYESLNYKNDFDGRNLSDGVYYWTLTYETYFEERKTSGTLTIIRQ